MVKTNIKTSKRPVIASTKPGQIDAWNLCPVRRESAMLTFALSLTFSLSNHSRKGI